MTQETTVAKILTPDAAIQAAINQFPTQAAFQRALVARSKQKLTKAAISQWVRRKNGAPSGFCPDIEAISGVPCEALRPEVSWAELRKTSKPPVYAPRR
jgi:hypothetical protein